MQKDTQEPIQKGQRDNTQLQINQNLINEVPSQNSPTQREELDKQETEENIKLCLQDIKLLPYLVDPTLIKNNNCPKTILQEVHSLKNESKYRNLITQLQRLDEDQYWLGDIIGNLLIKHLQNELQYMRVEERLSKQIKNREQVGDQNKESMENRIRQIQSRWEYKYNEMKQACRQIQQGYKKRQVEREVQQRRKMRQKQMQIKEIYNQIEIKMNQKQKQISQLREQLSQREETIDELMFKIRSSMINSDD